MDMYLYIVAIFFIIYLWFKVKFSFWNRYGFKTLPAKIPFGSIAGMGFTEHSSHFMIREYEKYKNQGPAFGLYFLVNPALVITDPQLIKDIVVGNFENFHDHGFYLNEKADPLSANLFSLSGQQWKNLRTKLTPTFTSGKMKMMFPILSSISDRMVQYLTPFADENALEIKEVFSSFTTEVIANVAFGLDIKCLGDSENEFRKMAKELFAPTKLETLKITIIFAFQSLAKLLNLGFNSQKTIDFFMKIVQYNLKYREENNVRRNDFFQLLIDIKNSEGLTINEIAANSFIFFGAGFETSSSVMTFCAYELALNQDVQQKLREEIEEVIAKYNGKVTYDAIMEMKYLDMVFNETLRMYPVIDLQIRKCTREFKIPNSNLIIPKDVGIMIPSYAIHRDERYYENPNKFDPERFTPENVEKRPAFAYFPFGDGPRKCIGMKFGTMQTKVGIVKVLRKFKIHSCSKTIIPMRFEPAAPFQSPLGGMWLKLENI